MSIPQRKQTRLARKKKRADKLWQQVIAELWRHKCAWCGCICSEGEGVGHHLFHKGGITPEFQRWRLLAGVYVCSVPRPQANGVDSCHNYVETHRDALTERIQQHWPLLNDWIEEHRRDPSVLINEPYVDGVIERLKGQLAEFK